MKVCDICNKMISDIRVIAREQLASGCEDWLLHKRKKTLKISEDDDYLSLVGLRKNLYILIERLGSDAVTTGRS